ncbi:hypothetical protein, partial [Telmatospirillum sp. J64-1]|uniref:hypothetical protein n=1 Tax=Telmatospirillum sp. J64-1 TaxID=2502183 RepID=UPI001C8F28F7
MPINEILPFAPDGQENLGDLETLESYRTHPGRLRGHQPGIALRALENRVLRQVSHIAAGLAQFIANRHADGVRDDGDLDALEAGLVEAFTSLIPDVIDIIEGTEGTLTVARGGTGATTAAAALSNLGGTPAGRTITAGNGLVGGG